jgi:hypothetical protein
MYIRRMRPSDSISAEGLLCLQFHWLSGTPPIANATFVLHGPSGEREYDMLMRPLVSGVPSWQRGLFGSVAQAGMPAVQSICRGSSVPIEKIR